MILAKWLGVFQPTAWRMGHAIRQMLTPGAQIPMLNGIVEVDEKYFGGKPREKAGVTRKHGRGTSKQ